MLARTGGAVCEEGTSTLAGQPARVEVPMPVHKGGCSAPAAQCFQCSRTESMVEVCLDYRELRNPGIQAATGAGEGERGEACDALPRPTAAKAPPAMLPPGLHELEEVFAGRKQRGQVVFSAGANWRELARAGGHPSATSAGNIAGGAVPFPRRQKTHEKIRRPRWTRTPPTW